LKKAQVVAFLVLVATSGPGCGDGGEPRTGLVDGDLGIFVTGLESGLPAIRLERAGELLVEIPASGFELGTVDQVDDNYNYDPWPLLSNSGMGPEPPAGLQFRSLQWCRLESQEQDRLQLECQHRDGPAATITIERLEPGSFRIHWQVRPAEQVAYYRLGVLVDEGEGLYGLGGNLERSNQRGTIRAMQTELDLEVESGNNEAHFPVPLLVGTRGWGVLVDSYLPGAYDVTAASPRLVESTWGTGTFSGEGLTCHLFAAGHPLDIYRLYYGVTGRPALPAPWALGPWIWRDENDDQAQVESDARTIREQDLATCALWIDRPYASGVNSFDFDPPRFPDPPEMVATLHDLGFHLALWHTPYIDTDDPATAGLLAEAEAGGYFPPTSGVVANNWSAPLDFTNPQARTWWQQQLEYYRQLGVEGYKLDYAEDVVLGLAGARNKWLFHDGSDERTMHSRYQLLYHQVYAEMLPADGGFLLSRAGTHRDQAITRVVWPGDLDANMARHRQVVGEGNDSYVAVGGLPASMIYGLALSASGFPFYGSDTGGYRHCPPDKETFTRWFEQTAFSTVMQVGTSCNDVPWEFRADNGFDQEMLDWYRVYARWHLRLWPYLWTLARRLQDDGRPIARPLGLACPEMDYHGDEAYLLGPDLLVAPVLEHGARSKEVPFPPGSWFDFWTGEQHQGGVTDTVAAPLGTLPLYQRAGSLLPLLRPTIDTLAPVTAPGDIDSFATSAGRLWVRVAPGAEGRQTLYDGSELVQQPDAGGLLLDLAAGDVFQEGFVLEICGWGPDAPVRVTQDGQQLPARSTREQLLAGAAGYYHDDSGAGWLLIKTDSGSHTLSVR